jgi:mono/diheme cytochrome c family protein
MIYRSLVGAGLAAALVLGMGVSGVAAQGKGDAAAGKTLYTANKCQTCHGDAGKGDGAMGQKLKDKPSDWTAGGGGLKGLDDQKIFDSIKKGGAAIGKSKAMPAAPKLSEADVWNLVAYVKTLAK